MREGSPPRPPFALLFARLKRRERPLHTLGLAAARDPCSLFPTPRAPQSAQRAPAPRERQVWRGRACGEGPGLHTLATAAASCVAEPAGAAGRGHCCGSIPPCLLNCAASSTSLPEPRCAITPSLHPCLPNSLQPRSVGRQHGPWQGGVAGAGRLPIQPRAPRPAVGSTVRRGVGRGHCPRLLRRDAQVHALGGSRAACLCWVARLSSLAGTVPQALSTIIF